MVCYNLCAQKFIDPANVTRKDSNGCAKPLVTHTKTSSSTHSHIVNRASWVNTARKFWRLTRIALRNAVNCHSWHLTKRSVIATNSAQIKFSICFTKLNLSARNFNKRPCVMWISNCNVNEHLCMDIEHTIEQSLAVFACSLTRAKRDRHIAKPIAVKNLDHINS